MKQACLPINKIRCISGAGQQHGSILFSSKAESILQNLERESSLVSQLSPAAFSYKLSPNWQDSSTQTECVAIEDRVGGPDKLSELTGSKAHHRFTGSQIMKIRKESEDVYRDTSRISLVSSFLCSLFLGRIAPIDSADICGGNFWDIKEERYIDDILDLISGGNAEGLRHKLGPVCMDGSTKLGSVSVYHQLRHGFSPACQVIPFTGDNPATILALPLPDRNAMISLGTSTTMLLSTPHYVTSPAYHVFAHPTTKGHFMAMLCYKNGSLAREYIRDSINVKYGGDFEDWSKFNDLAVASKKSRPGEPLRLGFYYPQPEIIPQTSAGTWYFSINRNNAPTPIRANDWHSPDDDARAILESQALDIRMRSQSFFEPTITDPSDSRKQADRIYVVGGASRNTAVVQTLGEVLGGQDGVYRQLTGSSNACAIGAANKAAWATLRKPEQGFEEFVKDSWNEEECIQKVDKGYRNGVWEGYGEFLDGVRHAEDMITSSTGKLAT